MILLEEKLYTSEETAEILGITPRTLYRYLKKGDIEAETKTKSGTFRFTRKQIYKYLYPDKYEVILQKLREREGEQSKYIYVDDSELLNKSTPASKNESNNEPKPTNNVPSSIDPTKPLPTKTSNDVISKAVVSQGANTNEKPNTKEVAPNTNVITNNQGAGNLDKSEIERIKKQREETDLNDELKNLESAISDHSKPQNTSTDKKDGTSSNTQTLNTQSSEATSANPLQNNTNNQTGESTSAVLAGNKPSETSDTTKTPTPTNRNVSNQSSSTWKYFVNKQKDILQLAKEVNSLSTETGRNYAATMHGGLSLHHDIDEFNTVHFYVEHDDLSWWVNQLELTPCSKEEANIVLVPTTDSSLFDKSYKLRGLQVVSDSKLIQDLMTNGEKELAKTLL